MYSVVLMAALTASTAEAPAFFKHSSMGCCGGLFAHSGQYASCMGFTGGCWGSCNGGYGGGYGGFGGCFGCMGCYGAYQGYGAWQNYGGWQGYGATQGYGAWQGYGAATPGAMTYPATNNPMEIRTMPGSNPPGTGTPGAVTPGAPGTPPVGGGTNPGGGGTSAKLIIEKPANAKLFVDDKAVKADGTRNTFDTPILDPSQAYYYMVRVEMTYDGKPVSETRRVIVRAGETVQETFREPTTVTTTALQTPVNR